MFRARSLLPLCAFPSLAACAWLLNFDDLQKGGPNLPDSGSDSGSEASIASCEASDCDDQDPCTTDSCSLEAGVPTCRHDYAAGLALEQDFPPVVVDAGYRISLVAGATAFYFSVFSSTASVSDVVIYELRGAAAAPTELWRASDTVLARNPVSTAGLAIDTTTGERLVGFLASKGLGATPKVIQVPFNPNRKSLPLAKVGETYDASSPYNYPVARALGGSVYAAWINDDGIGAPPVSVLGPTGVLQSFGSALLPVSTFTLIGTQLNLPAVVFSAVQNGVYVVDAPGSPPVPMTECQTDPGSYISLSAAALPGSAGVWFANWTKFSAGQFLSSENHVVGCLPSPCAGDANCKPENLVNGVRNGVIDGVHVQGDAAGRSYFVGVNSSVDPGAATPTGALTAAFVRIEDPFMTGAAPPTVIGGALVSTQPLGADFRGPDYPAVAILPPDKAAIGWIQPVAGGGGGDEFHLQRYKMCFPRP